MKYFCFLIFLLSVMMMLFNAGLVVAGDKVSCDNRYATLVNPVRGRGLWIDKTVEPLKEQYRVIEQYNFPATWLLQYDVLKDQELLSEIEKFNKNQEKGVFLEISENYAGDARVVYPHSVTWYSPKAVFLSAYAQSDRRKLIDKLFGEFKLRFGIYPRSVGAWWIDSYSLNYMKEKYGIKSVIIVADQKTTDNYGVWGQWWGVPYYPSKANILTPASSLANKQDVVIIQWAQRDPALAIGEGPKFSNYSLQANDYIRQGKKTGYFQSLINIYLDCQNPLGQVTVGLETGSDSVVYFEEYSRQLEALKNISNLQPVKMEEFFDKFKKAYPDYPRRIVIENENAKWVMTPEKRLNGKGENIVYNPAVSFDDYFVPKQDGFLNRVLLEDLRQSNPNIAFLPSIVSLLSIGIYSYFKKKIKIWFICLIFILASFGLILRSNLQFGWWIYYGPVLPNLYLYQLALPVISFLIFLFLARFKSLNLWFLPLSFAIDPVIQSFRVSYISEKYFIGFMLDALRFTGMSIKKSFQPELVNLDFPGYLAAGLLRADFARIWQNPLAALIAYPLVHILLAVMLSLIFRKTFKYKRLLIVIISVFFFIHLLMVFTADPFAVQ